MCLKQNHQVLHKESRERGLEACHGRGCGLMHRKHKGLWPCDDRLRKKGDSVERDMPKTGVGGIVSDSGLACHMLPSTGRYRGDSDSLGRAEVGSW